MTWTDGPATFGSSATDLCPCGRASKPMWQWLCRACYLEKEIGYALSELTRDGEACAGLSWHDAGIRRLEKLIGPYPEPGKIPAIHEIHGPGFTCWCGYGTDGA